MTPGKHDWVQYFEGSPVCIVLEVDHTTALLMQSFQPNARVQNRQTFWVALDTLTLVNRRQSIG